MTGASETIGEEVRERLGQLTPSERRVARALLATYPSAGLESLPQLAESAGVTGPTVLRFVRKVGFEGYPDFQRSLREEVQARAEGLPSLYVTRAGARDDDVVRRSHEAFSRALDATLASRSLQEDLASVVSLLSDPKRGLWFAGGRFSQLAAEYLAMQLRMLRPGCGIIGDEPARRVLDTMEIAVETSCACSTTGATSRTRSRPRGSRASAGRRSLCSPIPGSRRPPSTRATC